MCFSQSQTQAPESGVRELQMVPASLQREPPNPAHPRSHCFGLTVRARMTLSPPFFLLR